MPEKTIFDNINDVFFHKPSWDTYSETDKKKFSPYMLNRWISMNPDFIEVVNFLQQYTVGLLSNREVYKLFKDLLPKHKFFTKYVKADKDDDKISDTLINFLCETFHWNEREAVDNLRFISKEHIIECLKDRGYTDQEIKKFKLK